MASSALSILENANNNYFTYCLLIMGLSYQVILWSTKLEWIEPLAQLKLWSNYKHSHTVKTRGVVLERRVTI